ncbi:MAG: sensor histidine kinase [Actinomycetota bacterium]
MAERTSDAVSSKRIAKIIFVLTVILVIAAMAMGIVSGPSKPGDIFNAVGISLMAIVYTGAGALLVARVPRNPIGWIVIWIGFFQMANALTNGYEGLALNRPGPPLPLGEIAAWASQWTWVPSVGLLVTFLLLLFPDGHLPSPRWRIVAWTAGVAIGVEVIAFMAEFWPLRHEIFTDPNTSPSGAVSVGAVIVVSVTAICSVASVVVRYRRSEGETRQQLRWFIFAAAVLVIGLFLAVFPLDRQFVVFLIGFSLIPITTAIAVMKYRLYNLDIVIRKTVVFGIVAFVLTALYLGVVAVATVGRISRLGVGVLLLAVTFNPVRTAARSVADRFVYGKRASAYEVLTDLTHRMTGTYATDDVLPRVARALVEATGAASARVWLRVGNELRPTADAGAQQDQETLPVAGDTLPETPFPMSEVRHQGDLLGAMSVVMPANDLLDPSRERLMRDLASQAGLVLRNVALIEDLKASRQRLVAAEDEERRKLERNIHDGAQQQLVALAVKQRLVASLIGKDDERAREMVEQLQTATTDALEDLRDLARGIYPPLLADKGLAMALEAQARKAAVPVAIEPDGVGRYPQQIESAVYFSVLEALQNIAKYADASHATVRLGHDGDGLTFEVVDDGRGFDTSSTGYGTGLQGIADRLAALDGELTVSSTPGTGTSVVGRVPAREVSA